MFKIAILSLLFTCVFASPLLEQLDKSPNLSQYSRLVDSAIETFNSVTIFAPENNAITNETINLLSNKAILYSTLLYHVSYISAANLSNDRLLPSLAGPAIRINVYSNNVTTASCQIITQKTQINNSFIYTINGVMTKPTMNIAEYVSQSSNLTTLASLMQSSYVLPVLDEGRSFTLFAPTNEAFAKLPSNVVEVLSNNITLLRKVLFYHIISTSECSAGITSGTLLTYSYQELPVNNTNNVFTVNGSTVINADIVETNGVVHWIDQVLIPSDVKTELGL